MGGDGVQGLDPGAQQKGFAILYDDVGFGNLCLAFPQAFDFPALQDDTGFQSLFDMIVKGCPFVAGNVVIPDFGFSGHRVVSQRRWRIIAAGPGKEYSFQSPAGRCLKQVLLCCVISGVQ